MLRKIKLYGKLAEFVGHKEFEVEVDSIAKAVSFLIHNFKGIESHMSFQSYHVSVGNYDIDKDEIDYPLGRQDIHFVPAISGAGGPNTRRIILGVALVGLAVATGGTSLTFGIGGFAGGAGISAIVGNIGALLLLSGVNNMLFSSEDPEEEGDPRISFNFSGIQNTTRAGTPIPIVYGEILTGSVLISAGVDTNQVSR
tara:strand:+ start:3173 stop:3766 length:594 start_codon:yes stop_codon:yes gene_type:complete